MACMDYCQGHGACSDTMMCTCDQNRHGDSCVISIPLPTHLSDDFERSDGESPVRGQLIRGKKKHYSWFWGWYICLIMSSVSNEKFPKIS